MGMLGCPAGCERHRAVASHCPSAERSTMRGRCSPLTVRILSRRTKDTRSAEQLSPTPQHRADGGQAVLSAVLSAMQTAVFCSQALTQQLALLDAAASSQAPRSRLSPSAGSQAVLQEHRASFPWCSSAPSIAHQHPTKHHSWGSSMGQMLRGALSAATATCAQLTFPY